MSGRLNPAIAFAFIPDLRRVAYWCERPELFAAIAGHKDDEERFLAIVRWFIVRHLIQCFHQARPLTYLALPCTVSIFGRPHSKGSIPRGMNLWVLRRSTSPHNLFYGSSLVLHSNLLDRLIPSSVNFSMGTGLIRTLGDARRSWLNKSHTTHPSPPT